MQRVKFPCGSRKRPKSSLLDCPNEILLYIADMLEPSKRDINSLLRTGRFMQRLLTPVLYRHAAHITTQTGRSLLRVACIKGQVSRLQLLLVHGGARLNINARELQCRTTVLHAAVMVRRVEVVHLLLSHHAAVNAVDVNGWTPLHWAAMGGYCEVAVVLLDHGADTGVKAPFGRGATPLHFAAGKGHLGMVRLLLQRGACAVVLDNYGLQPFHHAVWANEREAANVLAEHGGGRGRSEVRRLCRIGIAESEIGTAEMWCHLLVEAEKWQAGPFGRN